MKKALLFSAVVVATSMVVYSCGGGGGGGSSSVPSTTPITSQEELNKAVSSLTASIDALNETFNPENKAVSSPTASIDTLNETFNPENSEINKGIEIFTQSNNSSITEKKGFAILDLTIKTALQDIGKIKYQAEGSKSCYNNEGTGTFKHTWSKPCDEYNEKSCMKNNTLTFTEEFINCNINGYIINGKVSGKLTFDENGYIIYYYIDIPNTEIKSKNNIENLSYNNFSWEFKSSYSAQRKDYSSSFKKGSFNYNGFGKSININFDNLSYLFSCVPDEKGGCKATDFSINGGLAGNNNGKAFNYKAQNLKISDTMDSNYYYTNINGYFYEGVCNKKWYSFKTDKPIKSPRYNSPCPVDGKLTLNNSFSLEATSSGGLNILDSTGKVINQYQSCKDYESEAKKAVCQ